MKDYKIIDIELDNRLYNLYCVDVKDPKHGNYTHYYVKSWVKIMGDLICEADSDEEAIEKAKIMIKAANKHNSIYGMKNMRTWSVGFKCRITLLSFYASRNWFWYFNRSKNIFSFHIRILGIQVHISEINSTEKLINKLKEKYKEN